MLGFESLLFCDLTRTVYFFWCCIFYVTITCNKSLFNLCVVSRPYGIDLHCHRRETLTVFFFLGHMACVGVCLCITGDGV